MIRRLGVSLVLSLALLGFIGLLAPPAEAQPKVTINGVIQVKGNVADNAGTFDGDYAIETNDHYWQNSMRGVLTVTGEMSPNLKGVFAFEYDVNLGQIRDCGVSNLGGNPAAAAAGTCSPGRAGISGGSSLGTDVMGIQELKHAYIDFKVPMAPARVKAGLFPVFTTLKLGNLLFGDVPGADVNVTFNDMLSGYFLFVQIEEHLGGGTSAPLGAAGGGFPRGDDYAMLGSMRITPMKGVTILPLVAYEKISGSTQAATRTMVGAVPNAEQRWYFGVDASVKIGNFSIDPTFIYLAGKRDWTTTVAAGAAGNGGAACIAGITCSDSDIRSFLADLRGSAQFGPLRLQGIFQYVPGNKAADVAASAAPSAANGGGYSGGGKTVKYFNNIFVDPTQNLGWSSLIHLSDLGDNVGGNGYLYAPVGTNMMWQPSYGPWGAMFIAGRADYSVTPALIGRLVVGGRWAAEKVDVSCGPLVFAACDGTGEERYLGTEVNVGGLYQIYPGLNVDAIFGYLFTGDGFAHGCPAGGGVVAACEPKNAWQFGYKLLYSF
ncbi:MAG TPA: hypothetical protein VJO34_08445 [Methylomirabilota bacterium]|nr:hypothetical protein [Methylomirabilota bacterium]